MGFRKRVAPNDDGDDDEEDKDKQAHTTVKTQLKNIIKSDFREILTQSITEKSIISTKICLVASLYFLCKIEKAYEAQNYEFFEQDGREFIRQCFMGVLIQNVRKMDPDFRRIIIENGIDLPKNTNFGNAVNDLAYAYTTNVKNNLFTHRKKRLREFLSMTIYERNTGNPVVVRYEDSDINHVISYAIYGIDSINPCNMEAVSQGMRRDMLLEEVCRHNFLPNDIPYSNLTKFTKNNWFKSLPLWIALQRKLDIFNTNEHYRAFRMYEREHLKECKKIGDHCKCGATRTGPPKVRNLSVIPICSHNRTHYTLDNRTLRLLVSEVGLAPQTKGKREGKTRNFTDKEFGVNKEWCWSIYFDMDKIKSFVHGKKKFHFRLLSNGQAVSILYDLGKQERKPVDKAAIVEQYNSGFFINEQGTDPGENTWQATVLKTIETGKEVRNTFIRITLFSCISN